MDYETPNPRKKLAYSHLTVEPPREVECNQHKNTERLPKVVFEIRQDNEVRVLVITGTGKHFCSRTDINDRGYSDVEGEQSRWFDQTYGLLECAG
jgi:enoyl-CoA hydratase/carnithine racemase